MLSDNCYSKQAAYKALITRCYQQQCDRRQHVEAIPQRRTVPSSDAERHCCALDRNATL